MSIQNSCISHLLEDPQFPRSWFIKQPVNEPSSITAVIHLIITWNKNEIDLITKARILHITGTYPETVAFAAGQIRSSGGKVSFDGGAGLYKEADRNILPKVNYCITAFGYAQNYTGKDSISAMLDAFLMEGVEVAGITCGTDGSWFKEAGGVEFHQPAFIHANSH